MCPVGYFYTLRQSIACHKCKDTSTCDTLGQIMPYRPVCTKDSDEWLSQSDHLHAACCGETSKDDYDELGNFKFNIQNWKAKTSYCVRSIDNGECKIHTSDTQPSRSINISRCCPGKTFFAENQKLYCANIGELDDQTCSYYTSLPEEFTPDTITEKTTNLTVLSTTYSDPDEGFSGTNIVWETYDGDPDNLQALDIEGESMLYYYKFKTYSRDSTHGARDLAQYEDLFEAESQCYAEHVRIFPIDI